MTCFFPYFSSSTTTTASDRVWILPDCVALVQQHPEFHLGTGCGGGERLEEILVNDTLSDANRRGMTRGSMKEGEAARTGGRKLVIEEETRETKQLICKRRDKMFPGSSPLIQAGK